MVVEVSNPTTKEEVNELFKKAAAEKQFKGILKVVEEPLVSTDFRGDTYSAIVDVEETMVKDNMVKVIGWYDNEWGYSCRLAEFAEFVGTRLR